MEQKAKTRALLAAFGCALAYLLAGVLPVLVLCLVILQTPPAAWAILLVVGRMTVRPYCRCGPTRLRFTPVTLESQR